jgi:hypothetical protein
MNELMIVIGALVCGFIVGRLTYTPERWVEDKMRDIESKIFERMSQYFVDRLKFSMDKMKDQIMDNLQEMKHSEVVRINASTKEEAVKQIISEFRRRDMEESSIKEHVIDVLKIEEDLYDKIAGK